MLLQWSGRFRGFTSISQEQEQFSGSLRFLGPGLDEADSKSVMGSLAVVLRRYWASTTSKIPGNCWLEEVKWNRVGPSGLYANLAKTNVVRPPMVAGAGAGAYPPQIAWCTTWQTDATRGAAARGRTFWPTSAPIDGETFRVAPGLCRDKALADAKLLRDLTLASRTGYLETEVGSPPDWLTAIGWAPGVLKDGSGMVPVVMSKIGAGTTRPITSVGVGNRLDVQRRRGADMADVRQVVLVSATA